MLDSSPCGHDRLPSRSKYSARYPCTARQYHQCGTPATTTSHVSNWLGLEFIERNSTYAGAFNINDLTQRFCRFHDGDRLDGNVIAETGSLTVDDARYVYVGAHAILLSSFDDLVVGADSLSDVSSDWYFRDNQLSSTHRLHGRELRLCLFLYLVETLVGIAEDSVSRVAGEIAE